MPGEAVVENTRPCSAVRLLVYEKEHVPQHGAK